MDTSMGKTEREETEVAVLEEAVADEVVFDGAAGEGEPRGCDSRKEMRVVLENRRRARSMVQERAGREKIISLAELLPPAQKNLILAIFEKGVKLRELASIHGASLRTLRRRLDRLRDTLCDPSFALAAQHGKDLPGDLAKVARAYWLEGKALREVARMRGISLHRVRQEVATIRVLLASRSLRTAIQKNSD